jgi:environmental stress-induced protein Ves
MPLRHLRSEDYRVMPWKNGLGATTEIAVHPEDAALGDFTWRLSIADLGASGPFSSFPGYDRILVQLEGATVTLVHEGLGERRLTLREPYRFAGELATHATVTGPARDFNVMVRRDRASADLAVRAFAPGKGMIAAGNPKVRIVFLVAGAASVYSGDQTVAMRPGETVMAGPGTDIALVAGLEGATAFLVLIAGV